MIRHSPVPAAEPLFAFARRARILLVGREALARSRARLHFVLITGDISDNSRAEILSDFRRYPVVEHYRSEDLERFFGVRGAKVVGFRRSDLSRSLYAALRRYRIN